MYNTSYLPFVFGRHTQHPAAIAEALYIIGQPSLVAVFIDNDATHQGITVTVSDGSGLGGIQVYAALKDKGNIVKTEPEFEKLYEDNLNNSKLLTVGMLGVEWRVGWGVRFPTSRRAARKSLRPVLGGGPEG